MSHNIVGKDRPYETSKISFKVCMYLLLGSIALNLVLRFLGSYIKHCLA